MSPSSRVLIVEDDPLLAMAVEQMVEDLGHTVVGLFHSLKDGLWHAGRDDVDFALLDFDLGRGTNSVPIAEELARRLIPFAFVTHTDADHVRAAVPDAVVTAKPLTGTALARLFA